MQVAAKLAEKLARCAPGDVLHVIVKARLLEKDIIEDLTRRPQVRVRHIVKMVNAVALALPCEQIERLAREPWVARIEEDEKVYAVIDESVPLIGVPDAWAIGYTGSGIKVAIIDTGIDTAHPDFDGRILATRDFTLEGFIDSNGHGSHVAGIAVGAGAYSAGKFRGVAPDALIISGKVLRADGSGRMSDVMAAIEWSVDLAADVINLSLGTSGSSDGNDALCETCDAAVEAGVVVCVATGNDGPGRRTIGSPGAARRALTVGAATAGGIVAEFSSRGPTADDRRKPEVVAPGVDVVSVRAKNTRAGKPLDNYYTSATGTSMAAAHVTGIVALLLEANRDASPQLVREALIHTADDLELDDFTQGAGLVVAGAALRYVHTHENPPEPHDQAPPRSACLGLITQMYEGFARRERRRRTRRAPEFPLPERDEDEFEVSTDAWPGVRDRDASLK